MDELLESGNSCVGSVTVFSSLPGLTSFTNALLALPSILYCSETLPLTKAETGCKTTINSANTIRHNKIFRILFILSPCLS